MALAAEVADGWLPMGYGPDGAETFLEPLQRGLARRHGDLQPELEAFGSLSVEITDDVQAALDARKPMVAMYVGGMGSGTHNFHAEAMARSGVAGGVGSDRGAVAGRSPRRGCCRGSRRLHRLAVPARLAPAHPGPLARGVPAGLTGVIIRCRPRRGPRAHGRVGRHPRHWGSRHRGSRHMTDEQLILIDEPAEHVRRITLNRPHKRNAISTPLRAALFEALHGFDEEPDARVAIVRGAGPCFSSGYDLSGGLMDDLSFRRR